MREFDGREGRKDGGGKEGAGGLTNFTGQRSPCLLNE